MLYHFSEEVAVARFAPRKHPGFPGAVWAIGEAHEFTYYFLQNPRIVCGREAATGVGR